MIGIDHIADAAGAERLKMSGREQRKDGFLDMLTFAIGQVEQGSRVLRVAFFNIQGCLNTETLRRHASITPKPSLQLAPKDVSA